MKRTLLAATLAVASAPLTAELYYPPGPVIDNTYHTYLAAATWQTSLEAFYTRLDLTHCDPGEIFVDFLSAEYPTVPHASVVCQTQVLPVADDAYLEANGFYRLANGLDGEGVPVYPEGPCTVVSTHKPFITYEWRVDYRFAEGFGHGDGRYEVEIACYDALPLDID